MISVRMVPHIDDIKKGESGIHTVVRKWFEHLPKFGIELVSKDADSFDILAVHAGMGNKYPNDVRIVAHCHGVYWTSDYPALSWEWAANETVVASMRRANAITVPSNWVAETIQRDLRIDPTVIPHGVDWEEWQHTYQNDGYILAYAKNRVMDVCNPAFITELAKKFPDKLFLCTFAPKDAPGNVRIMGLIPHDKMKQVIQRAAVVISPIKETFGILTLESMASGIPVLGYNYGGNKDLIRHGVNGYLARVGDFDDMANGLNYCIQHRKILSSNAKILSRSYTWDNTCNKLAELYSTVMDKQADNRISVIIPSYNYAHKVGEAIRSALNQTLLPYEIIVVDDGSTDNTEEVVKEYARASHIVPIHYHRQNNAGVATARNAGIAQAVGGYIVCLDADDKMDAEFLRACAEGLNEDPTLGIAYTGLLAVEPDGKSTTSSWPPQYNFDDMVYYGGINQIPTCCMFRRSMWERIGGFRSRYCPHGAGSEDAEFWLRAGLYGFPAKKVTDAPLFIYSYKSGRVSGDKSYHEIDWRSLHPSTKDKQHPIACVASAPKSSHPARQYDEPLISVVIPIGPGHKQHVFNALDSLEAQTLRKWEVILVDDTGEEGGWEFDGVPDLITAYPYVKIIKTPGLKGTGFSRNRGAEKARAALILFLDADDNLLVPEALEHMLMIWNETGMGVYTDYMSKAVISEREAEKLKNSKRLVEYDPETGLAMHLSYADEYECERAVVQPANPLYIWNLISTLIPKSWHDEIGGFDEKMPSWEDWEYWLRMARRGKCFIRLAEPMIAYRFYTGGRRETGIQMPQELLAYITQKLEGVETMPCRTCGSKKSVTVNVPIQNRAQPAQNADLQDDDFILISYENPNRGLHKVVGAFTKKNYGYRQGGGVEKFYVHKKDAASQPDYFKLYNPPAVIVEQPAAEVVPAPSLIEDSSTTPYTSVVKDIPTPSLSVPDFIETKAVTEDVGSGDRSMRPLDLQNIPGVTNKIADELAKLEIKEWKDILNLGTEGLMKIEGVGVRRAETIFNHAQKMAKK